MPLYTDIDYDSFPPADLDLDLHWIQLPRAIMLEKQKAREAALHARRSLNNGRSSDHHGPR